MFRLCLEALARRRGIHPLAPARVDGQAFERTLRRARVVVQFLGWKGRDSFVHRVKCDAFRQP